MPSTTCTSISPAAFWRTRLLGSVAVQLLPYIGERTSSSRSSSSASPGIANTTKTLIERMPKVFASPQAAPRATRSSAPQWGRPGSSLGLSRGGQAGQSVRQGRASHSDGWPPGSLLLAADSLPVCRMAHRTRSFFEAAEAVPWTKPEELPIRNARAVTGKFGRSELPKDEGSRWGCASRRRFHAAMADGRITFFKSGTRPASWRICSVPSTRWVADPLGPQDKVGYTIPLEPTPASAAESWRQAAE